MNTDSTVFIFYIMFSISNGITVFMFLPRGSIEVLACFTLFVDDPWTEIAQSSYSISSSRSASTNHWRFFFNRNGTSLPKKAFRDLHSPHLHRLVRHGNQILSVNPSFSRLGTWTPFRRTITPNCFCNFRLRGEASEVHFCTQTVFVAKVCTHVKVPGKCVTVKFWWDHENLTYYQYINL